ncbi:MAG: phage tail tape measure protein [Pseudomonadota bacterium]
MNYTEDNILAIDSALAGLEAQLQISGDETGALTHSLGGMSAGLSAAQGAAGSMERSLSGGLKSAMRDLVFQGASLTEVFRTLSESMVAKTFNASIDPLTDAFAGLMTNSVNSLVGSVLPFAKGGVISNGQVTPFAKGGVVSTPTTFPMASGTGLMGEAGPEAIMPLARGADGRLGVRGGGNPVQVVMNISTPDASSFQKSRSQVAAGLSRALQSGRRNM